MYGEATASGPSVCPGEAACEKWQGTPGKTQKTREKRVCHPCDLFPTKRDGYHRWETSLKRLVVGAKEIRRRRLSGYPFKPSEILQLEFLSALILDDAIEFTELRSRQEQNAMMKAILRIQM
jgi:hypothetical protein